MAIQCDRCSKENSAPPGSTELPLFCMFCGHRLHSHSANDATVQYLPSSADASENGEEPTDFPAEGDPFNVTRTHSTDTVPEQPSRAPSMIGGYRLHRFIGGGGMGNVYEGESLVSGQRVAVKLLSKRLSNNAASAERFRQEGRLASQISHPRCVFVLRADAENGRPFIVMELMPGRTLKDLVDERGPLPIGEAVTAMQDVIEGLIQAHRLGVIHRDVKPSNCFLTEDGRVKVGDFGLSKSLSSSETDKQLTYTGTFLGTILFAAPEQIRHEPVGYDSDVYAVCATLYYLLCGQAPHQHDSLTAVLAKAISEPAPPLRPKVPGLSAGLERVILRGLERDRNRRYQTLEELRDALNEQLPTSTKPAGLRSIILAYFVDYVALQSVALLLEFARQPFSPLMSNNANATVYTTIALVLVILYHTIGEGLFGSTLGKAMLQLRVQPLNQTGPPGLWRGFLRTIVYNAIWFVPTTAVPFFLSMAFGSLIGILSALCGWVLAAGLILIQVRRTPEGFRGLHDYAAGTHIMQRSPLNKRSLLLSHLPNPLSRLVDSSVALPEKLEMFNITGKLCDVEDGGQLWLGEDASLSRRVLIRVEPPGGDDAPVFPVPVVRPTRLRIVGHGRLNWGGGQRNWTAYVAPTGNPITDVLQHRQRLNWTDASEILSQATQEILESEHDCTPLPALNSEHLWVDPSGRLQVLDFPLPTGSTAPLAELRSRYPIGQLQPYRFLRELSTLLLEGKARNTRAPIAAPLPRDAQVITTKLMNREFQSVREISAALEQSRFVPDQVSMGMRLGQLSVQGMLLSLGLLCSLLLIGFFNFYVATGVSFALTEEIELADAIATPEKRAEWLEISAKYTGTQASKDRHDRLKEAFEPDKVQLVLEHWQEADDKIKEARAEASRRLNRLETGILDNLLARTKLFEAYSEAEMLQRMNSRIKRTLEGKPAGGLIIRTGGDPDNDNKVLQPNQIFAATDARRQPIFWTLFIICMIWPLLLWPLFAGLFRGGLNLFVVGLRLVNNQNGKPAARWRCALRCLLVWLPFVALMTTTLWVQLYFPYAVAWRTVFFFSSVLWLFAMIFIALKVPARGPHDKLLNTTLMPN